MLNKLFNKPLELKIGEKTLFFNSVSEIAFCLDGRTSISSEKLSELFQLSVEQLESQAKKLSDINSSLFEVLNRIVDDPDNIDRSMRELDPQIFSQDQGWRDIVQALNKGHGEIDTIRVTVIMKYMKYLSSLDETVGYIITGKKLAAGGQVGEGERNNFEETWSIAPLRTEIKVNPPPENNFKRLPKDKKVTIKFPPNNRLDVRLATYQCQLVSIDNDIQLINKSGATSLSKGLNTVGRSTKCTVKIDPAQKHVSRTHLNILIDDNHMLQLTDTSSEGTFINSDFQN
jgi:FHA domain-containing protein